MQPAYDILINELVQGYRAKLENLRAETAMPPELKRLIAGDYACWLSVCLEDALDDAWSAGDIDSARQIDNVIRQFCTGHLLDTQHLLGAV